jgi:hypothetical protein
MSTRNVVRLAKEFVVKINDMVIARCTDFSFSADRDTIDITSFDTAGFTEYLSDNKNWTISFGSMVTREAATGELGYISGMTGLGSGTYENLLDLFLSPTGDYPVVVGLNDSVGSAWIEGYGILQSLSVDGAVGDKSTYSGNIQGSGQFVRGSI